MWVSFMFNNKEYRICIFHKHRKFLFFKSDKYFIEIKKPYIPKNPYEEPPMFSDIILYKNKVRKYDLIFRLKKEEDILPDYLSVSELINLNETDYIKCLKEYGIRRLSTIEQSKNVDRYIEI